MAMPSKLKNMSLFNDAESYIGLATSVTPPKLSRKMEAYRAGGMNSAAKADFGWDDDTLKFEWTVGGYAAQVMKQIGTTSADGVQLRFMGAYQRDDTGAVDAVEIVVRGRHSELDRGEAKVGEDTEWKISTECVYYKETWNGEVLLEIDTFGMIDMMGGIDRSEAIRRAIGM